jgi:1,4-alpha-glucan branching enzyme
MPVDQRNIGPSTPMGATLVDGGATFRTWAPNAADVYVVTDDLDASESWHWEPHARDRLIPNVDGTWAGFVSGVSEGDPYLFWVRGPTGHTGFKRDPYARELCPTMDFPDCHCLVRDPATYPWQATDWHPPSFPELIIYQLHVGAFWALDAAGNDRRATDYGKFLDLVGRIQYLRDLGINAIQLLPIQEFPTQFSLGYNGVDYFSPENEYQVNDEDELVRYLEEVNAMLSRHGKPGLTPDELLPGPNQLKCLVDLCHLNGLAVIFDVVYNHAGGDFGDRSLWFYDRQPNGNHNNSLYFTDKGWAGGSIFAYWQAPVRQLLIDNARFLLEEYRADGLRYDEVSVAVDHGGDRFCRDITDTLRFARPDAIQIAEYWNADRAYAVTSTPWGLGFDAALSDRLRDGIRRAIGQAAAGSHATVNMDALRDSLYPPPGFAASWKSVHCLENHDLVRWRYEKNAPDLPRVPALADSSDHRSWYARSRSRLATTLLLTAPGIPMLFMGQEILEDKPWSDDYEHWSQFLIWWEGLERDAHMRDFRQSVRDLLWLRRTRSALHGDGVRVSQVHNVDRVLVMHRWVESLGEDVVVVLNLSEHVHGGYLIDLPHPGTWYEIFNSDFYDHFPNHQVAGNGGRVVADRRGQNGYPHAAVMTIPANGAVILAKEP